MTTSRSRQVDGSSGFLDAVRTHELPYAVTPAIEADEEVAIRETGHPDAVDAVAAAIRDLDVEGVFLARWREVLARVRPRTLEGAVDSVDVTAYLDGVETVMDYHLATRGLQ